MRFGARCVDRKWYVWDYKKHTAVSDVMGAVEAIKQAYQMSVGIS